MKSIFYAIIIGLLILGFACTKSNPQPSGADNATDPAAATDDTSSSTAGTENPVPPFPVPDNTTPPVHHEPVTQMGSLPERWPADLLIMPGLEIVNSNTIADELGVSMIAACKGDASMDDVQNFYMNLEGWNMDTRRPPKTTGDLREFMLRKSQTEYVGINITTENGKTVLQLSYREIAAQPNGQ
ncbi:MAG: hypothetical protein NTY09_12190 [bacterium]|nr:hypothetical protein [bacterium]